MIRLTRRPPRLRGSVGSVSGSAGACANVGAPRSASANGCADQGSESSGRRRRSAPIRARGGAVAAREGDAADGGARDAPGPGAAPEPELEVFVADVRDEGLDAGAVAKLELDVAAVAEGGGERLGRGVEDLAARDGERARRGGSRCDRRRGPSGPGGPARGRAPP